MQQIQKFEKLKDENFGHFFLKILKKLMIKKL